MRIVGVAAVAAFALLAAAGAQARVLAQLPEAVDIDALGGWVVWSAPEQQHFVLRAWHAGVVTELPVAGRPRSFDFDLGTDRRGRVVATYSRCTHYGSGVEPWGPLDDRGCAIRVLDLASGRERAAGEPRARGLSHRTPAMWRGRIAYGEYRPYRGEDVDVTQIRLWSPVSGRVLTKHHGFLPSCTDCLVHEHLGWTQDMDLGDRLLAFNWAAMGNGSDKPSFELRAEDSAGRSRGLARGGAGEGYGVGPLDAAIDGRRLWFGYVLYDPPREQRWLYRYTAGARKARRGHLDKHIVDLAVDRGTFYALTRPNGSDAADPCSSQRPCTLERLPGPPR